MCVGAYQVPFTESEATDQINHMSQKWEKAGLNSKLLLGISGFETILIEPTMFPKLPELHNYINENIELRYSELSVFW